MKLFTIGTERKKPDIFFALLEKNGVKRVVDIRLKNTRGMVTWLNKEELKFFLARVANIDYVHELRLAPTEDILAMKDWTKYEPAFKALIASRHIETLRGDLHDDDCLLCYENDPAECHRGLVAEYLKAKCGDIDIVHLQNPDVARHRRSRQ